MKFYYITKFYYHIITIILSSINFIYSILLPHCTYMEISHPFYYWKFLHFPAFSLPVVFRPFLPLHRLYHHPTPSQLRVRALRQAEHQGSVPRNRLQSIKMKAKSFKQQYCFHISLHVILPSGNPC